MSRCDLLLGLFVVVRGDKGDPKNEGCTKQAGRKNAKIEVVFGRGLEEEVVFPSKLKSGSCR